MIRGSAVSGLLMPSVNGGTAGSVACVQCLFLPKVAVDLINLSGIQCFARIEHVAHAQAHPFVVLVGKPAQHGARIGTVAGAILTGDVIVSHDGELYRAVTALRQNGPRPHASRRLHAPALCSARSRRGHLRPSCWLPPPRFAGRQSLVAR
ncbi:hypothetical protein [Mycobacterium tuberculosis]|uniref:hypothetical protein n=1 Tax=Mycobacterium tuberculosis TaxID=1773 RepID=UPI0008A855CD|nr:hypothetical protein [Mycobacterium tuberculosis]